MSAQPITKAPSITEIRLSLQNQYADFDLTDLGISNKVWTLSGYALKSNKRDSLEQFLSYSDEQIKQGLESYLLSKPNLSKETNNLIVLDMENPVHPKKLGTYNHDLVLQNKIIDAFKRRIAIARQVFTNAKLSMYGVINAPANGDTKNPGFSAMMKGYIRAGELGMYDDLDYLSPSLYHRFSLQEKSIEVLKRYTRVAVKFSKNLKTSQGKNLPLAPFLGLKIYNGQSEFNRKCVSLKAAQAQFETLKDEDAVKIIIYWAANASSSTSMEDCNIRNFFEKLRPFAK